MSWLMERCPFLLLETRSGGESAVEVDPHGLRLRVVVERLGAAVTAEPRRLEAAEGHDGVDHVVGVDPYGARFELGGQAVGPAHVPGPHRGGQAGGVPVGPPETVLLALE